MPENTIKVASVVKKESKKGKDFWVIKDGNDDAYFAWEKDQADLAQQALDNGQAVTIVHEGGEYKTVKEIQGPKAEPALGDGSYVKGKTNPEDKRSIAASVALKAAVDTMAHTIPTDATAKVAADKVLPLFQAYLKALEDLPRASNVDFDAETDSDVPF